MNEDTTDIDLKLIADDLDVVAKLAGRLGQLEIATKISALAAEVRKLAEPEESA